MVCLEYRVSWDAWWSIVVTLKMICNLAMRVTNEDERDVDFLGLFPGFLLLELVFYVHRDRAVTACRWVS